MATTNLSYASIGEIQFSSGNGVPDHNPTTGSIYINIDTGTWFYHNGSAVWTPLKTGVYGEIATYNNTGTIGIAAANTWYSVANRYAWTEECCKGMYINNNKLQSKESGLFNVEFITTIQQTGTVNAVIEAAVIKNESTATTYTKAQSRLRNSEKQLLYLSGGIPMRIAKDDRIEIVVRNITDTTDCILENAHITAQKLTD